ncbi:hypothetical protein [Bacteroides sp.]|uniref:hypothetical protein n=1 Tax=Bacteroides sp. TaxID=29523 RepID=UPI002614EDF5|nr:hypothetical protein [Bacteroides sp.]MDD3040566.1 hypothetical protein [Bacteroides sp.]
MVTIASINCTRTRENVACALNKTSRAFGTSTTDALIACIGCTHAEIIWTTAGIERKHNGLKNVFNGMDLSKFESESD